VERAWILTLGLPAAYVSILHWVEDVDPERLPMIVHADAPLERRVRMGDGSVIVVRDLERRPDVADRMDLERVATRLSSAAMRHFSYKEIDIGIYPVGVLANELLALRDSGIVHYR